MSLKRKNMEFLSLSLTSIIGCWRACSGELQARDFSSIVTPPLRIHYHLTPNVLVVCGISHFYRGLQILELPIGASVHSFHGIRPFYCHLCGTQKANC